MARKKSKPQAVEHSFYSGITREHPSVSRVVREGQVWFRSGGAAYQLGELSEKDALRIADAAVFSWKRIQNLDVKALRRHTLDLDDEQLVALLDEVKSKVGTYIKRRAENRARAMARPNMRPLPRRAGVR